MLIIAVTFLGVRQTRASYQKPEHVRLAELLAAARESKNLSRRALSIALGKQPTYIARVERGERLLEVSEFIQICRALDVDALSLFSQLLHL